SDWFWNRLPQAHSVWPRTRCSGGRRDKTPKSASPATETATENTRSFPPLDPSRPGYIMTFRDGEGRRGTRKALLLVLGDRGWGVQISPLRPAFLGTMRD